MNATELTLDPHTVHAIIALATAMVVLIFLFCWENAE